MTQVLPPVEKKWKGNSRPNMNLAIRLVTSLVCQQ
jgi:hypothetical protein